MNRISFDELLGMFDPDIHERLRTLINREGVAALVVFENRQLDSSAAGARSAVAVGPGCSHHSVAAVKKLWLNDLPSQRQYPVAYAVRPDQAEGLRALIQEEDK